MLHKRNEQGTIVAIFAILLLTVFSMGTLVIDLSNAYVSQTKIRNAVDFSTLAGVSQIPGSPTSSNILNAKNAALNYLNNNLTMTLPSFSSLELNSTGLTINAGIYDFTNKTFIIDEASSNVNALKISYQYTSMNLLASFIMANAPQEAATAVAAKRSATKALPGSAFPFVIYTTVLDSANNNMISLYSASNMDNSFWTDYTLNNASTTDVGNEIDYFQTGIGTAPRGVTVNDTFAVNDGGMGATFMNLDPNILVGMNYLFSLVTPTTNNVNVVRADGFVAATINSIVDNMGSKSINITIVPGYIDNTFGGLQLGGSTNIPSGNDPFLAKAYGLVQ
ncbi:MAG: Tad domain-containing protein [Candidatus Melainabacteria bacterium]|nr:Tad domain-containing protein [Candidatus Melainabacteria bacterium]